MAKTSAKRVIALAVGAGVLACAGVFGWWQFVGSPPEIDPGLAAAVLPVIDAELEREGPWDIGSSDQRGRWFCAEQLIEIRRADGQLEVGLHAVCDAFASDGTALRLVGGQSAPKRVIVTEPAHQVIEVETGADGAGRENWIDNNFSLAGARELHRQLENAGELSDQAASEAKLAFGLPPDATIRR
ncbi:hypothetical protein FKR81_09015 [Lentzea tibetensis]|uniref:Uncharacterized protein n=1 Tax=Lentzea tibetensis TaxID=2591470 RepID=A0A563EXV0_9PSEU|nr:hypothetical protein [Lentzea tibetensis]TWP52463.1 hypothetical protein FKR81_09015 [Lentzea tibetensis]